MAFDPDKFLQQTAPTSPSSPGAGGFDPDAFLAGMDKTEYGEELPWLHKGAPKPAGPGDVPYPKADIAGAQKSLQDWKATEDAKPGELETYGRGLAQGGSAGFADEIVGGVKSAFTDKTYRQARDEYRARDQAGEAAHPGASIAGNVLGGLLTAPIGGSGGALRNVATGVATGAAYGAGMSEADLTKGQGVQLLKDAGKGALVGGAIAGGGEALRAGVKKGAQYFKGDLERRILNEVAEGTANTTPTARKKLDAASKNILAEVIEKPDAEAVRKAYTGDAGKGRKMLEPIINKLDDANQRAYKAFEDAGQGSVSTYEYLAQLEKKAQEATKAGRTRDAQAIRAVAEHAHTMAKETGGLTLTQLRGFTTEAQGIAGSVLGGLNEHANAKVAKRMGASVSEAMSDTITKAAHGNPTLTKAAKEIAENNSRLHALLTIDDSLKQRAYKESTGSGPVVKVAKNLLAPTGLASAAGIASGDEDKIRNMAIAGAAGVAGMPLARAIERGMTTAAIKAAQKRIPVSLSTAERIARTTGRLGGGALAYKKAREEDDDQ